MSIVTVKTVNKTFVDFVDFVDADDPSGENDEDDIAATADKAGTCTWPVFRLRSPSALSTEEESCAERTPRSDDDASTDFGELEAEVLADAARCEAGTSPSSPADVEEDLSPADADSASPCAISMWHAAAASFYFPPPRLASSPPLARKPACNLPPTAQPALPPTTAAWPAAGAELPHASGEASPFATGVGATPASECVSRLQQLRRTAALPAATPSTPLNVFADASRTARTFSNRSKGNASPAPSDAPSAFADAPRIARTFSNRSKGSASSAPSEASPFCIGPLPAASWVTLPRAAAPQTPVAEARRVAATRATKVNDGPSSAEGMQHWQDPKHLERRRHPVKQRPGGEQASGSEPLEGRTTIMQRNIPNNYTRDMLHELIETRGFGGKCDFLYLPMDFHTQSNLGYAFVNLKRADDAPRFWETFEGFSTWALRSRKVCSLRWSECQGLEANINRYRNSALMGDEVPDCHKPAVFAGGERIEFPAPTKPSRASRIKQVGLK